MKNDVSSLVSLSDDDQDASTHNGARQENVNRNKSHRHGNKGNGHRSSSTSDATTTQKLIKAWSQTLMLPSSSSNHGVTSADNGRKNQEVQWTKPAAISSGAAAVGRGRTNSNPLLVVQTIESMKDLVSSDDEDDDGHDQPASSSSSSSSTTIDDNEPQPVQPAKNGFNTINENNDEHFVGLQQLSQDDFQFVDGGSRRPCSFEMSHLIQAAKCFLKLPYPQTNDWDERFQTNDLITKAKTLLNAYDAKLISMLSSVSHVGRGTDPERLEQRLLNTKQYVLAKELFPTHIVHSSIDESYENTHLLQYTSLLSNQNQIDFGLSGEYSNVSLGFNIASEHTKINKGTLVHGITDYRYVWAIVTCNIKKESLHKGLSDECYTKLRQIEHSIQLLLQQQELCEQSTTNAMVPSSALVEHLSDLGSQCLIHFLTNFVQQYGTHLILKCSIGYRVETKSKKTIYNTKELHTFKQELDASMISQLIKSSTSKEHSTEVSDGSTTSTEGTLSVGSRGNIEKSLKKHLTNKDWSDACAYGGDAGVISHDETIMIADVIKQVFPFTSNLLRKLTYMRIRDLQLGWTHPLFHCSYVIQFNNKHKNNHTRDNDTCCGGSTFWRHLFSKRRDNGHDHSLGCGVLVQIHGIGGISDTTFYDHSSSTSQEQEETFCVGHVTNNLSSELVTHVKLIVIDPERHRFVQLNDLVSRIDIYIRRLEVSPKNELKPVVWMYRQEIGSQTLDDSLLGDEEAMFDLKDMTSHKIETHTARYAVMQNIMNNDI